MIPFNVEKGKLSKKEVLEILRNRGVNADSVTLEHTEKDHICGVAHLASGRTSKFEVNIGREGEPKLRMRTKKEEAEFTAEELEQAVLNNLYRPDAVSVRQTPHGFKVTVIEGANVIESVVILTSRGANIETDLYEGSELLESNKSVGVTPDLQTISLGITDPSTLEVKEEKAPVDEKDYVVYFDRQVTEAENNIKKKYIDYVDELSVLNNLFEGYKAARENLTMAQKLAIEERFKTAFENLQGYSQGVGV